MHYFSMLSNFIGLFAYDLTGTERQTVLQYIQLCISLVIAYEAFNL
jgi:hypothetical protein